MIEYFLKEFAEYGIIGLLIGWLFWKDWKVTNRIFKVIENNTEAMTQLKNEIADLKK